MRISRFLHVTLLLVGSVFAETVKDREGAVRQERSKMEHDARWNWNNVDQGFAAAKKSGKPVLVVLRCVPCMACMGIDTGVLMESGELKGLLDQFECVRLINANALDLTRFQFDYDLSFNALFFNPDGTVYGRYGSWKHQKNSQETALEGFKKALTATLDLHKGYPANKALLAGKQPGHTPVKTPVEMPTLSERYSSLLNWDGKVVASCVHCHMIGEALRSWYRDKRQSMPESLIYPFPEPETIGLTLRSEEIASVESVEPGSIAADAGIKAGDQLVSFAGQPLVSIADVSWAMHRTANEAVISAVVKRDGKEEHVKLILAQGWRRKSDVTRRVTVWPERGMVLGGMRVEPFDGEGIGLKVKGLGQFGLHATAKKSGFKEGDIILAFDGLKQRISEGELIGHLFDHHQPGDVVKVSVRRGTETVELTLPMQ